MYEDKDKNTNYQVPHGFSSDEDDADENADDFTDVQTPGESPDKEDETPTDEDGGISFELDTEEEDVETSHGASQEDEEESTEEPIEIPSEPIEEPLELPEDEIVIPSESEESRGSEATRDEEADVSAGQATVINKILDRIAEEIDQIKKLLPGEAEAVGELTTSPDANAAEDTDGSVVEGVFDGEGMVGSDGKHYDVPANYASKSKLVEGDILKLTVNPDGSFLFKQIGPSERNRVVGTLAYDPTQGRYLVTNEDKKWYILTASVTYFKGKPGDETVILVPKAAPSRWAAVENIISKKEMVASE